MKSALLFALLATAAMVAAPVFAQDSPSELILLHDDDTDPARRRALRLMTVQGAGRFEPEQLTPAASLLGDGWGGSAPRTPCARGESLRAAPSLAAEVDTALQAIEFGKNALAIEALARVSAALPCAGEPLDDAFLARLWFLTGAVHFLEGRPSEARAGFERAALVDFSVAFDDLFPATVHDSLLAAKDGVLSRPRARVVVWADGEVRIDGRVVPVTDGVGWVDARTGPRLVQHTVGARTISSLVDLSATPARDGVASLVLLDAGGLDRALRALESDTPGPALEHARAAILGVLAERGEPYALLVASRADRQRGERALTALDVVAAQSGPYRPRNSQADAFGRRARIAVGPMYRGLSRPKESALHYGGIEVVGWVPLHWAVRAGFGVRWAYTPRPAPEGKTACCSTFEVTPRVRLERGSGTFRPFGELGFLLFWPASTTEGAAPGALDVAAGFDVGGGLMVTPGEARRVGIALSGFGGAIAGIGPMISIRLSAEVRF